MFLQAMHILLEKRKLEAAAASLGLSAIFGLSAIYSFHVANILL